MARALNFKVSSALKDIIGRDLITDDYIAVFELVKNSFDAHANQVDIYFENIYTDNAKIIIKDNGKGMAYDDIVSKWLFVAYSAKKEGTEDDNIDYRDNIYSKRVFAGAKGIGRFSCDRLGRLLYLESTKKEASAKTQVLITDWEKFEANIKDEFVDISVSHSIKTKSSYGVKYGTVLEITELRSKWDRDKLVKLRDSLAKLINPNRGKGEQRFKIIIHVPEELERDNQEEEYRKKVNGEIKNFIFDALGLKTTKIEVSISGSNKRGQKNFVTTKLTDGGTMIYSIKEKNPFNLLWDIDFTLYFLNQSAKLTFAKRMGLAARKYGHVFLYKNGFRIYPFGEPFEDPLRIDVRKSRKKYSYLGTGELIGQIEIFGDNREFKETSSRGNGLIKNETYDQLEVCFLTILERLEKYVVDVQKWGLSIEDDNTDADFSTRISDLITQLTNAENILEFDYSPNFLNIIENSQSDSAEALVRNLNKIAVATEDKKLLTVAKKAANSLAQIKKAKEESDKDADQARREAQEAEKELELEKQRTTYLLATRKTLSSDAEGLVHNIVITTKAIVANVDTLIQKITENKIKEGEILKRLSTIKYNAEKAKKISQLVTRANFKTQAEKQVTDIAKFVEQYVSYYNDIYEKEQLQFKVNNANASLNKKVNILELSMMFDNLISNSEKANATIIQIELKNNKAKNLIIQFSDNGKGLDKNFKDNPTRIFDLGITTTDGSGIGLNHVEDALKKINGKIEFLGNGVHLKGACFQITIT